VLASCEFVDVPVARQEQALASLVREQRLTDYCCASVVDHRDFSLLLVEAPQVGPTELKAAVRWRIRELLDFHIDDAVIDVFDIPGQRERGRPKLMYAVAARMATVQQHIGLLERPPSAPWRSSMKRFNAKTQSPPRAQRLVTRLPQQSLRRAVGSLRGLCALRVLRLFLFYPRPVRAKAQASTWRAPARRRTWASSLRVAPVVMTSSRMTTCGGTDP